MRSILRPSLLALLAATACGGGRANGSGDDTDTSSASTTADAGTDESESDGGSETQGDTGTDTTGPDPDLPDAPLYAQECDIHLQDCPPGEKCLMYKLGLDDGGLEASRQFCSPVVATPLLEGESCTITGLQESPLGYQDDCEPGFYCDGGLGNRCTMLCRKSEGSDESPLCEFPRRCHTGGVVYDGARCSTPCEPMSAEGDEFCTGLWGEDAVCGLSYLFGGPYAEGLEWETKCNSTGGFPMEAGEPCTATCSNPSLTCAPSELLGGSCAGDACCTQVCDVNEGNAACTEMGHECVPMFPDHLDDPMYGHFGYCGIPS